MSKCSVSYCDFYSCRNNKCSMHNRKKSEVESVKNILAEYFYDNIKNIINHSQFKNLLIILSGLNKDDPSNLKKIISDFLKLNKIKYLTLDNANNIMELLSVEIRLSHLLVHCIFPFVIDVWNISEENKWPAVCYYQSHDISYSNKTKFLNQVVVKKNFVIPKVPPRFSAY